MKKGIGFLIAIFVITLISSCGNVSNKEKVDEIVYNNKEKVEVYYFHYTRRCKTCNTVEKVTNDYIVSLNNRKLIEKAIFFQPLNLDEEKNDSIADKLSVSQQALVIVYGEKKVDLTNDAFLNAVDAPMTLRNKIKESVETIVEI